MRFRRTSSALSRSDEALCETAKGQGRFPVIGLGLSLAPCRQAISALLGNLLQRFQSSSYKFINLKRAAEVLSVCQWLTHETTPTAPPQASGLDLGQPNTSSRVTEYSSPTAAMLGSLQPRQLLTQLLNFALVLSTAFMLWKGLSVATDSPSPIVVVLSGSMEPAFQRGDLLFLWNRGQDTQVGEIVVYNVKGKDIPIVHRVVRRYGGG